MGNETLESYITVWYYVSQNFMLIIDKLGRYRQIIKYVICIYIYYYVVSKIFLSCEVVMILEQLSSSNVFYLHGNSGFHQVASRSFISSKIKKERLVVKSGPFNEVHMVDQDIVECSNPKPGIFMFPLSLTMHIINIPR